MTTEQGQTQQQTSPWRISACGSADCRKAIIWARTDAGARTPVDAAPSPDGRWLLVDYCEETPLARYIATAKRALPEHAGRLHTSHWATCTNPAEHRSQR